MLSNIMIYKYYIIINIIIINVTNKIKFAFY